VYTLRAVTRFSKPGALLQEPRTITYEFSLIIGQPASPSLGITAGARRDLERGYLVREAREVSDTGLATGRNRMAAMFIAPVYPLTAIL
jgi:hypothetical protein